MLTLTFDDSKGTTHYGWEAYVRHLAKTYPGKCVTIDDVLAWNNLRLLKMDDQGGKTELNSYAIWTATDRTCTLEVDDGCESWSTRLRAGQGFSATMETATCEVAWFFAAMADC